MNQRARLTRWALQRLREGGTESQEARAVVRALSAAYFQPASNRISSKNGVTQLALDRFRRAVNLHIKTRTPVQYLCTRSPRQGWPWHCLQNLQVRPPVLCPRPETETLVDLALAACTQFQDDIHVLDMGCGSGAIGIALAVLHPHVHVLAVDVHPTAVRLTQQNAARAGVQDRVLAVQSSARSLSAAIMRDYGGPCTEGAHIVVSNPPYIPAREYSALDDTVKQHEHPLALVAGSDGLDVIRDILQQTPVWLRRGGTLLMETDSTHPSVLAAAAQEKCLLQPKQGLQQSAIFNCTGLPAPRECAWWPHPPLQPSLLSWPPALALVGAWSDGAHDRFVQLVLADENVPV